DHSLWHNVSFSNGANVSLWSGWASLGQPANVGGLCSDPSAVTWTVDGNSPVRIDVFAMDCTDHHLWHIWYASNAWQPWESPLFTPFTSLITSASPVVVSTNGTAQPSGSLHVLFRDVNGLVQDVRCQDGNCNEGHNSWSVLSVNMQTCSSGL